MPNLRVIETEIEDINVAKLARVATDTLNKYVTIVYAQVY